VATISKYASNFAKIDIPSQLPIIIQELDPEAVAYNQQQLYRSSVDRFGKSLKKYQSPSYAIYKYRRNPLPGLGKPDLNLTGTLYRGMYLKADRKSFYLGSIDSKEPKVERKYGKDIWGLTRENKARLSRDVRPLLMGYIRGVLRA